MEIFKINRLILLLFVLNFTACNRVKKANSITIIGSDTMINLVASWAEEYIKINPNNFIAVTGGGSGIGIANLISGSCDIASTSRKMKKKEIELASKNNVNPVEYVVGLDGIAVIVHPANPISQITMDQLSDIFTGKVSNWKDIGGKDGQIVILSRETNSGTHIYFKEKVLRKGKSDSKEEFSPSALLLSSSQSIADEITNNRDAIGYYGMGYINPKQKVLKIAKSIKEKYYYPDIDNVVSGKYPISRPLFLYVREDIENTAKQFMDFVFSKRGQELVRMTDFVPVK